MKVRWVVEVWQAEPWGGAWVAVETFGCKHEARTRGWELGAARPGAHWRVREVAACAP